MSKSNVVVVTGVLSGIGRVTAGKLAKQGCQMFGTVRNIAKAVPLPGVQLVEMDVSDDVSVQRGNQFVIDRAKRIDVLINNAGVGMMGSAEETTIEEAQWMFDTNVFGILRTSKAGTATDARTALRQNRQCQFGARFPSRSLHGSLFSRQACR
jgi:NADP-dependent 3-hydroxy acid dehydrogenase YdfG